MQNIKKPRTAYLEWIRGFDSIYLLIAYLFL